MPQSVKLHVSSNNASNGVLNVKITPWRVHLKTGDFVVWDLDATGPAKNDIQWFRIEQIDQAHPWPFQDSPPPDPMYTGTKPLLKVTSPPKYDQANPVKTVIAYGLTICFLDDTGRLRTMYIDPDMIIDS